MKIFHIVNGRCHWDATLQFPTTESTVGRFPPSDLFVEAPDEVQEGWAYRDGEFFPPEEVEQYISISGPQETTDAMLIDHEYRLSLLELGL